MLNYSNVDIDKIEEKVTSYIWYKYFYKKDINKDSKTFNSVKFPKINRVFS